MHAIGGHAHRTLSVVSGAQLAHRPPTPASGLETGGWTLVEWSTGITIRDDLANAQPFGRHPNRMTGLGRSRAGRASRVNARRRPVCARPPRGSRAPSSSTQTRGLSRRSFSRHRQRRELHKPSCGLGHQEVRAGCPETPGAFRRAGAFRADEPGAQTRSRAGCREATPANEALSMCRGYPSLRPRRMAQSGQLQPKGLSPDLGEGRTICRPEHITLSDGHRSH